MITTSWESNSGKTRSVREIEEGGESVARRADRALEEILGDCHKFGPTWTGLVETKPGIFGGGPGFDTILYRKEAGRTRGYDASFGGSRSEGLGSSAQGKVGVVYSDSLLSQLRQRRDWVDSYSMLSEVALSSRRTDERRFKYLKRNLDFFICYKGGETAGGSPITNALLNKLNNIPDQEDSVFRRLLKKIAISKGVKWHLKTR